MTEHWRALTEPGVTIIDFDSIGYQLGKLAALPTDLAKSQHSNDLHLRAGVLRSASLALVMSEDLVQAINGNSVRSAG